jgi:hypothetical protein
MKEAIEKKCFFGKLMKVAKNHMKMLLGYFNGKYE